MRYLFILLFLPIHLYGQKPVQQREVYHDNHIHKEVRNFQRTDNFLVYYDYEYKGYIFVKLQPRVNKWIVGRSDIDEYVVMFVSGYTTHLMKNATHHYIIKHEYIKY